MKGLKAENINQKLKAIYQLSYLSAIRFYNCPPRISALFMTFKPFGLLCFKQIGQKTMYNLFTDTLIECVCIQCIS